MKIMAKQSRKRLIVDTDCLLRPVQSRGSANLDEETGVSGLSHGTLCMVQVVLVGGVDDPWLRLNWTYVPAKMDGNYLSKPGS